MSSYKARELWFRIETIHAVTYFAPECREATTELGLRGFWMGYFAARAAPMGAVPAGVVEATFFNFHPEMVRRAIPAAWALASPDSIVESRATSAARALTRLAPDSAATQDLTSRLTRVIANTSTSGRPLFAANRDLTVDDGPDGLWQCCTTLREHRGDGHVAVLTEAGLDGCEVHVFHAAAAGIPTEVLRDNRGWSSDDWTAAEERLAARGLIQTDGRVTPEGQLLHTQIEHRTDELAAPPYAVLGEEGIDDLLAHLDAFVQPIRAANVIPFPNPIGLPDF